MSANEGSLCPYFASIKETVLNNISYQLVGLFFTDDLHTRRTSSSDTMNSIATNDILDEVWEVKDSLSAKFGHDLAATCRNIYAEQAKHPEKFVNLGESRNAQQAGADQQAARREPNLE